MSIGQEKRALRQGEGAEELIAMQSSGNLKKRENNGKLDEYLPSVNQKLIKSSKMILSKMRNERVGANSFHFNSNGNVNNYVGQINGSLNNSVNTSFQDVFNPPITVKPQSEQKRANRISTKAFQSFNSHGAESGGKLLLQKNLESPSAQKQSRNSSQRVLRKRVNNFSVGNQPGTGNVSSSQAIKNYQALLQKSEVQLPPLLEQLQAQQQLQLQQQQQQNLRSEDIAYNSSGRENPGGHAARLAKQPEHAPTGPCNNENAMPIHNTPASNQKKKQSKRNLQMLLKNQVKQIESNFRHQQIQSELQQQEHFIENPALAYRPIPPNSEKHQQIVQETGDYWNHLQFPTQQQQQQQQLAVSSSKKIDASKRLLQAYQQKKKHSVANVKPLLLQQHAANSHQRSSSLNNIYSKLISKAKDTSILAEQDPDHTFQDQNMHDAPQSQSQPQPQSHS